MGRAPVVACCCAAAVAVRGGSAGDARVAFEATPMGFAFSAGGGARYAVYDGPTARTALRGAWVAFHGDSSLRGVYLSLLQLVGSVDRYAATAADGASELRVRDWLRGRDPRGPRPRRRGGDLRSDSLRFGWIDAILNGTDGALLAVAAEPHDMHFGADARPAADASDALGRWWNPEAENVRLTFRMLTSAHALRRVAFPPAPPGAPRPSVEVAEVGSWDHARGSPPGPAFEDPLLAYLRAWVAAGGPGRPLVYASMPRPFAAGGGDGTYERGLAAAAGVPFFLNRVAAAADLAALVDVCPCAAVPSYHPPHLQNLWDVQRLLNLVRPDPSRAAPSGAIDLAAPGFAACCCAPPNATRATGDIAHWARVCVPARAHPP